MKTTDKSADIEQIACGVCLKEVPISEAIVPEATDYVVHFRGLDCYEAWKRQGGTSEAPAKKPD